MLSFQECIILELKLIMLRTVHPESVHMVEFSDPLQMQSIEPCVRTAIAFGRLSPAAEAHINRIVAQNNLTATDQRLLALLNDALQTGWVHRVYPSWD